MILRVYSVYDNSVKAFMTPFFARADGEAVRMFQDACADTSHNFSKHAHDYVLYCLGAFNDTDGSVAGNPSPDKLIAAVSFKAG